MWALIGNITSGSNNAASVFGDALGFSGDGSIVAIGDKNYDLLNREKTGVVKIYQENTINGTWDPMGISLFGSEKRDLFGWSVALSKDGNRLAASSLGSNEKPGNIKIFDFQISIPRYSISRYSISRYSISRYSISMYSISIY